ncbi:MAG: hypothetical protein GEU90_20570 [Gemmatimonas sp.]|nr:hypothetical protein [Gemmatimonas sp.]
MQFACGFSLHPAVEEQCLSACPLCDVRVPAVPDGYLGDPDIVGVIDRTERDRSIRFLETIARVRPGFTVAEAQAELSAFIGQQAEEFPVHEGWGLEAVVLADDLMRPVVRFVRATS